MLSRKINISLSRQQTVILRGLSIFLIMLHNFLHNLPYVLKENEFSFNPDRAKRLYTILEKGSRLFPYDMVSFFGWYGVAVFIFLSGYGLVKHYEDGASLSPDHQGKTEKTFSRWKFIQQSWLKLFSLMWLGVLFYTIRIIPQYLINGTPSNPDEIIGMLLPLTCLNDLFVLIFPTQPGVYWYFGLAFELYVVYALLIYRRPAVWMWLLTIVSVVAFILLSFIPPAGVAEDCQVVMRHNFPGWMLTFCGGVWLARNPRQSLLTVVLITLASCLLFLPSLSNAGTFLAADLMAVVIFIITGIISSRIKYWGSLWLRVGKISAFLFVVNPLMRYIMFRWVMKDLQEYTSPPIIMMLIYVAGTFAGALIYRWIWKHTDSFFKLKPN